MQEDTRRTRQRWIGLGICLVSVLLLAPLLLGSRAAFPAGDDYVYAVRTHAEWARSGSLPHVIVDAFRNSLQIYRNWQGTFTGALMMALSPVVFSWRLYPWHAVLLVLLSFFAFLALLREACRIWLHWAGRWYVPAAFLVTALFWCLMPDLREGLYWFNSAWFYTATQCLLYLAIALTLGLWQARGRLRYLGWPLLWLLMLWLGLDNYVTAVLAFCMMGLLAIAAWRRGGLARYGTLAAWGLLAAALLISVLAPGNAVRLATDAQSGMEGMGLGATLLSAMGQSFVLIGRYFFATPLWVIALLVLVLGAWHPHPPAWRLRYIALLPVLLWLLLVAMLCPHLYTSGYIGPARVVNLYQGYILLASLGYAYILGSALSVLLRAMHISRRTGAAGAVVMGTLTLILGALVAFVLPGSYRTLLREMRGGSLTAYRQEMVGHLETLEQAPAGSDVVITQRVEIPSIGFPLGTDDPANWNNEALARVFDVATVRVVMAEDAME